MVGKDTEQGATAEKENNGTLNQNDASQSGSGKKQQENLFTRVVTFDQRSYFLDVRENNRGQYLKLTESSAKRRSTILLSGNVVGTLMQVLDDAIKGNFEPQANAGQDKGDKWSTVFSRRVQTMQKKIYFDLMENKYGRSLNIAEVSQARPKTAVIVSEHGWFQFQRALSEVIEEFPAFQPSAPRGEAKSVLSKKMQLSAKTFFFDLMENNLGRFLKLSELRKGRRETLFIPSVCFDPIIALLEKVEKDNLGGEIPGMDKVDLPGSENEPEGHKTLDRRVLKVDAEDPANSKTFNLDLRENTFGKFLRFTEIRPGKSSAVFLPADGFVEAKTFLEEFRDLDEAAEN